MLLTSARLGNAGQLYGIAAECGVKAILVACGVPADSDGSIDRPGGVKGKAFKEHFPKLHDAVLNLAHTIPDGRTAATYLATMPHLACFFDWSVDHRFWRDAVLPTASVTNWQAAAGEVMTALDMATENGVL
ncbi:MAG: hypothetical protein IPG63_01370 [Xanthomonadales bacterium]|nr:hypothetical protein [Xanthomonadales bacterium]